MSLRWIYETQIAPICDEESSDIEDSSDDSDDDATVTRRDTDEDERPEKSTDHSRQKRESVRHPVTSITFEAIRKNNAIHGFDPNASMGNPVFGPVMQLHSMTGFRLAILPSGKIQGFNNANNPYARLRISSVAIGVVQIRGEESGLYLAFNERGRLYGEKNKEMDNTTWEHMLVGSYDAYLSRKYSDQQWYVGIKVSGRPKPGPKTALNQKATKFLPIRS